MRLKQTVQVCDSLDIDTAVEDFMLHQRSSRHSDCTIKHYQHSLKLFKAFLEGQCLELLESVQPRDLRRFFIELQDQFKPKTAHGIASDVRAFFSFHESEENLAVSPMKKVDLPKVPSLILPPFDEEEVKRLEAVTSGKDVLSVRNRAIVLVLLDSGIRLKEMALMKVGDVDMQTGTFKVLGKGNKERICILSAKTLKALSRYLKVRKGKEGEPLWAGVQGFCTYWGLAEIVENIGKKANVHAHPHKFRRTCALTMLRNGADLFSVQYLLGHSDLTVLKKYLAMTKTDYLAAHKKFSPVMSLTS